MTKSRDSLIHWNYFLALEADLDDLSRYIEFTESNFNTYSIELTHLLLASSSEVDVVMKSICKILDPTKDASNINDYRTIVASLLPELVDEIVFIPRYGLELKPWSNWSASANPDWWKSYNDVKHNRDEHFKDANLQNTLNSVAALLVSVFYYYSCSRSKKGRIDPRDVNRFLEPTSKLLRLQVNYYYGHLLV
jgi:hypothetical protein